MLNIATYILQLGFFATGGALGRLIAIKFGLVEQFGNMAVMICGGLVGYGAGVFFRKQWTVIIQAVKAEQK